VTVDVDAAADGVVITATARTADRTGVEMEALTAAAVAGLTIIDMVKGVDPAARIAEVAVVEKTGGQHGDWHREQ
jgi:cyclic pyranopterin phosphate synthase